MKNILNYIFLIIILIVILPFTLEISLRLYLSLKHIENPHVSYWGKTWYRYNVKTISGFNKDLLADLITVNYQKIDRPRWQKNSKITINESGFRENDNNILSYKNKKKILTTGDSLTFGEQVSNDKTWPSYLEKKSRIKVFNGGHPGFSSGQSLKKAIILSNKSNYDYFIWSVIYDDFDRDYATKFIIKENKELKFNEYERNKKYKKIKKIKSFYHLLKENLFIVYIIDRELLSKIIKQNKKIHSKSYRRLSEGLNDYTEKELITFLINQFLKIEIDKKYILIQHTDQSENTSKKLRNARYEQIEKKYSKILLDTAVNNGIKVLDTRIAFENMSENEKRLMWFDHHTPAGNKVVADFIFKNINF
jgi:hypothetical protein